MENNNHSLTKISSDLSQKAVALPATVDSSTSTELSIYHDAPATPEQVAVAVKWLASNFEQPQAFWRTLTDCIMQTGMTRQRLKDAMYHALCSNHYARLSIADICGYDVQVKTYTFGEIYKATGQFPHRDYCQVQMQNEIVYVRLDEAQRYNLNIVKTYE